MQLRSGVCVEWLVTALTLWQEQEWTSTLKMLCYKNARRQDKITSQKAKWASKFCLGHHYADSSVILRRKANMLIIKHDCCLLHSKTEGNEVWNVKSKRLHWDHCVNTNRKGTGAITVCPLTRRKEKGITNNSCFHGSTNCREKNVNLKLSWEPRWTKVSLDVKHGQTPLQHIEV